MNGYQYDPGFPESHRTTNVKVKQEDGTGVAEMQKADHLSR
jgi:hypothetical protein